MKKKIKYTDEPIELGEPAPNVVPPPEWFQMRRQAGVKVTYDADADVLRVRLSDAAVSASDKTTPGVILDYDAGGQIIGIELLDASRRSANPRSIQVTVNERAAG